MSASFSSAVSLVPLVLAQVPAPDRSELTTVLLGGAALAVILNQLFSLWKNLTSGLKEQPPPSETYQRKEDCRDLCASLRSAWSSAEQTHTARTDALRKEFLDAVGGVHRRVDQILAALSHQGPT